VGYIIAMPIDPELHRFIEDTVREIVKVLNSDVGKELRDASWDVFRKITEKLRGRKAIEVWAFLTHLVELMATTAVIECYEKHKNYEDCLLYVGTALASVHRIVLDNLPANVERAMNVTGVRRGVSDAI